MIIFDYIDILRKYLISWWMILLIPILFFTILIFIGVLKKKSKKYIFSNIILITSFILLGLIRTVPVVFDISHNTVNVMEYKSAYYYNQAYFDDSYDIFAKQILVIKDDETKIQLGDPTKGFPFEMENGTIIYTKYSKLILEFDGEIINQNHF